MQSSRVPVTMDRDDLREVVADILAQQLDEHVRITRDTVQSAVKQALEQQRCGMY